MPIDRVTIKAPQISTWRIESGAWAPAAGEAVMRRL
jgi:hypothetical protein